MDLKEARSYLNYLLTLNIRQEEAFGPMALAFIKDNDLGAIGLEPEEQFGLLMATVASLADEPKRSRKRATRTRIFRGSWITTSRKPNRS